jgi:FecR protein
MAIARLGKMLVMCAVLAAAFLVVSASAESKARIVRLSEVEGPVQIEHAAGDGFGRAFINLPVIEGSRLKTGRDGRAEVEFEDGSALRLGPGSEVVFARLALGDDGQKLDTVQLVSGTIYANLHPKSAHTKDKDKGKEKTGDQFLLNFGNDSIAVSEAAHFRIELDGARKATVAVFKGNVNATSSSGQVEVAEKHSATVVLAKDDLAKEDSANSGDAKAEAKTKTNTNTDAFVIAKNYETDPSDAWDHQQTDYHDRYASTASPTSLSPYGYGMSDLNYYGNFMTLPGYGNVWQPYFIGANWSPFQDGGWAFYPGAGYTFVSGYPWGWMPYRSGNWAFVPGFGWVWEPGAWNSFNAAPRALNAPARTILPMAPASGHQTVMVGLGLAANPIAGAPRRLTINPGSAGFGVPRGSVSHLDHVAKTMNKTSRPVSVATAAPPVSLSAPSPGFGSRPGPSSSTGTTGTMMPASSAHRSAAPVSRPH